MLGSRAAGYHRDIRDKGEPAARRRMQSLGASVSRSRRVAERRFLHGRDTRSLERLAELAEVASERASEIIKRSLAAAREELGMDVAFVSEFDQQWMVFRELVGEAESFGWREGESVALDDTFCRLLLEGRLPNAIPDAKADGRVRFLEITGKAGIGAYVGAPVRFSDGTLYGTFCLLSHSPEPSLVGAGALPCLA